MQHGVRTKYHLIDWGWNYGGEKWMSHAWTRRGHTRPSLYLRWMKRQFIRDERNRGKHEIATSLD